MLDLSTLAKSETVEDVITFLARDKPISSRSVDFFFNRFKARVIDHGELLSAIYKLVELNILMFNETGLLIKGPAWREPDFMREGKYGIAATREDNAGR